MRNMEFIELSDIFEEDRKIECLDEYLIRISSLYSKYPHKCITHNSFGSAIAANSILSYEDRKTVLISIEDVCKRIEHCGIKEQIPGADVNSIIINLRERDSPIWKIRRDKGLRDYLGKATTFLYQTGKLNQIVFAFNKPLHKDMFGEDVIFYKPANRTNAIPLRKI